ncbi:hypothetical protein MKX79_00655 [Viridibacillus sp. FSL R5-0468]
MATKNPNAAAMIEIIALVFRFAFSSQNPVTKEDTLKNNSIYGFTMM